MHFGLLVWATLLAAFLCTPRALAADLSEAELEQRRQDAAQRYERGVQAYQEGRHKDAIELFLEADALAASSALSFNIARAYEHIKDSSSALRWYRDYLRREPNAEDKDKIGEIIRSYEQVLQEKGVQQLTVLSEPATATVRVDGRPVGVTPWTGELPPGKHEIALSLRGYADSARDVTLAADRAQDIKIRLLPASEATPAPGPRAATGEPVAGASVSSTTPADTTEEPAGIGVVTYVVLGAGVATLAAAGVFEFLRRSAEKDAKQSGISQIEFVDSRDNAEQHQTTARVLAGVGGAITLAGGVLLALDLTRSPSGRASVEAPNPRLSASGLCLGPSCFLALAGSF